MTPDDSTAADAADFATAPLLAALARTDATLDARGVLRKTLAPSRPHATRLCDLAATLFAREPPASARLAEGLTRTLGSVADVIVTNFPENIFWDVDFLVASLWRDAGRAGDRAEAHLDESAELVVELNALFGCHTDIRFRYTHDFIYGYDWAKWVKRDPAARASVGPFALRFLRALKGRARELLALIAEDDEKYGRLQGQAPRNPFGFSREPACEELLHRDLAAKHLLPIESWNIDALPAWDRPFPELRAGRAQALGLSIDAATTAR